MIIPCMNSTSFGERGGKMARVEDGSVSVGWPGAPGCTTTGAAESGSCAQTGSERKHTIVPAVISPPNQTTTPFPNRNVCFKGKDFICMNVKTRRLPTLSQSGIENHLCARRPIDEIFETFVSA